jgi:hypothetical protein
VEPDPDLVEMKLEIIELLYCIAIELGNPDSNILKIAPAGTYLVNALEPINFFPTLDGKDHKINYKK